MKLEFISKSLDYLNNDPYRTKVADTIKNKIKAYLTKMVEDKEILAELISEE